MAGAGKGDDEQFEQASAKLDEGLKSCRSVVANYRSMLIESGIEAAEQESQQPSSDSAES